MAPHAAQWRTCAAAVLCAALLCGPASGATIFSKLLTGYDLKKLLKDNPLNAVKNVGRTWKYNTPLAGDFITPEGAGSPSMEGAVEVHVFMLPPSLLSTEKVTYRVMVNAFVFNCDQKDPPGKVWIGRGSQHVDSEPLFVFPTKWNRVKQPDGSYTCNLKSRVGDTSAVISPGFQVSATKTIEYLLLFPGHHHVIVASNKFPKGAIRGQLVKIPGLS